MGGHDRIDADELHTSVDEVAPAHDPRLAGRLLDGTEVDGYVIDGVLGKGGMGIVYRATHKLIGKRAAIKVLRTEVSQNPVAVERFIQEAQAVNKIGHPNIIDIFDFGTLPDGRAYHLMGLMDGESLRQRLRRGPLHPSEAASVIDAIASALNAAHDKGFVHRDLKPDNVYLITQESAWPEVKLLDFGLAKLMPEAGAAAFITKAGVMLGTPEYMSPEQARGVNVDHRTDIYALGVVMFEILSGHRPFPSTGDAFSTLQYHAEEPPPSLASVLSGLPDEMVQLVDAMLAKEPAARPSLAAVRTVIKRLRTTQLPTRSIAGLELASLSDPRISADQRLAPSRLGPPPGMAHEPAPEDLRPTTPHRVAQPPTTTSSTAAPLAGAAGLARPGGYHGGTTLGVAPPPKPAPAPAPLAPKPPSRASSRGWLIVGALIAIAAGVAIALIAVGR